MRSNRRMLPALVTYSRRHIDLQRVATALCPGLANGRPGA
ncbi:putative leader peptide [Streptomyces sp. NPDC020983]